MPITFQSSHLSTLLLWGQSLETHRLGEYIQTIALLELLILQKKYSANFRGGKKKPSLLPTVGLLNVSQGPLQVVPGKQDAGLRKALPAGQMLPLQASHSGFAEMVSWIAYCTAFCTSNEKINLILMVLITINPQTFDAFG